MINSGLPQNFYIKVIIWECRQLSLGEGSKDNPCPYVTVKIGDEEKQTLKQIEQPAPKFNERYDFTIITTVSEIKTMKILFTVWHNTTWYKRDEIIGTHSADMWTVYSRTTHMVNKVWVVLEKEGTIMPGYIKYSVIVVTESDKLMALVGDMEDENDVADDGEHKKISGLRNKIEGAPPLENKNYLMSIDVYKGEFCKLPWIKELNAKFRIIVNEGEITESVAISNTRTPSWKETYNIPMRSPFYINFIIIEIYYEE